MFLEVAYQTVEAFLVEYPWNFIHLTNEDNIIDEVFKIQVWYPTIFLLNKEG